MRQDWFEFLIGGAALFTGILRGRPTRGREAHVARADRQVVKQRWTVARLERDGKDTTAARAVLTQFEETRKKYIAERDRLRRRLGL
jgi:hypothetical protein